MNWATFSSLIVFFLIISCWTVLNSDHGFSWISYLIFFFFCTLVTNRFRKSLVFICGFFIGFYFLGISGILTDELRSFLELHLPKVKGGKKSKFSLGVMEPKIGSQISELTKIPCQSNEFVHEILRGVRLHFDRFIKDLKVCILFRISFRSCWNTYCFRYYIFFFHYFILFFISAFSHQT